jgi:hypothetical protein
MDAVTLRIKTEEQGIPLVDQQGRIRTNLEVNDALVLNSEQRVERVADKKTCKRILQTNGIAVQEKSFIIREYIVYVHQTKVLFMYRSKNDGPWVQRQATKRKYQRVFPSTDKSREVRHVQELAIRAVYSLGLDYAVVICGIASGKKIVIRKVNPRPKLSYPMQEVYASAMNRFYEQYQEKIEPEKLLIGADPEFVMKSPSGNLILASKFFPLRGRVGCDAIWLGQNRANKPLVEVRPKPSADPQVLVQRIYECLTHAANRVSRISCSWLAGSMPYDGFPIGGHIHFSGVEPNFAMLRALDNYLTLPLTMAEDKKGIARRPKYGYLGDYRLKKHGGFEYRTPPSWLVSPTLTKGVIAVAKVIVLHYQELTQTPLHDPDLQVAYYEGDKEALSFWAQLLCQELKEVAAYERYKKYIDPYMDYINSGKKWDESRDFRRSWRLPPYRAKSRRK